VAISSIILGKQKRPMGKKHLYVYIMTNKANTVLYTGVTNNIRKRVYEHKNKLVDGFTKKYNVVKLVYYEAFSDCMSAIQREKQIKAGSRRKKEELINSINKEWRDLYDGL
jgi:putative endonuclease